MKVNDVILQTVSKVATFIILTFGVYLFLAGHHEPGGGFIGGLVLASALVLLYLAFDIETVAKGIPINYRLMAGIGVLISVCTGIGALFFGTNYLNQEFAYFDLPIFGETELTTVTIFEIGVSLAVIGTALTIILSISEDVD
ncbi:Na(+)/H(+) antiporter subunit B [Alkalicoccobacillus murimartini]|uniref:Multicomponent Na+:H+ antiporter subunit B n=1 Tax=Alkalicoccobacillus murimartini TaxID=171685 RepID=A0ABT9YLA0_9BACI|nr:Na(+)/H(+) antiporter subunit B [Alkalicoccobacillus murimartini]MDQ0207809.1 multicomponent Na+:H+ antiporter subunit B [Alkalicoccobacillus murimartini]